MSRVLFNPSAALFLPAHSQSLCSRSLRVRWSPGRVLKDSGLLVKLMAVGQESIQSGGALCKLVSGSRAFWFEGWEFS